MISITHVRTVQIGTTLKIETISLATDNDENMPVHTDILVSWVTVSDMNLLK